MIQNIKLKIYRLLKKSEKYTKTDMIYLVKGGFWLTLGTVFASFSSFLLAIAYANLLPKETYGTYKYILSIVGILGSLSLTGAGTAIIRSVAKGFDGTLKFVFLKNLKWSMLASIASFLVAFYYFFKDNTTLAISFFIAGISIPFIQSFGLYSAFLNGKKEFKTITIYGTVQTLISSLFIFITILLTKNPAFIIFVYFLSQVVITAFLYFKTIKKYQKNTKIDKTALNYSKHLSLVNTLNIISAQIDKILVFHYLGAPQLAIYVFATVIPDQIKSFLKNIKIIALPKFSEKNIKLNKISVKQKSIKLFLIIFLAIIIYIILAPFIYNLFFSQYQESIFLSQIYSVSLLAATALLPISSMYAQKQQKKIYAYNIFSSIFSIATLFFMIYFYGLIGAIVARVMIKITSAIVVFIIFFYKN